MSETDRREESEPWPCKRQAGILCAHKACHPAAEEAARRLEEAVFDYCLPGTGFITTTWHDGRTDTSCAWCRQTSEQGHDEECSWVTVSGLAESLRAVLDELATLRAAQETQRQLVETWRKEAPMETAGKTLRRVADQLGATLPAGPPVSP